MSCPKCGSDQVLCRQHWSSDGNIKRRRECDACGHQFVTAEILVDEYERLKSLEPIEPLEKPCDRCPIRIGPDACTNRECVRWRAWWLQQWEKTRERFPETRLGGGKDAVP